ncbi:MAG: hypothetical protein HOV66_28300 [Streptomycetaceae bacterium]|nr:hypothetical protein [Streptomycetaceae bacterium]
MTTAQAEQILDRYTRVNTQANATFDAALWEFSHAGYQQRTAMDASERAAYKAEFSYVDRTFYLPGPNDQATWFAVTARVEDRTGVSDDLVLLIVDRDSTGAWKVVASASIAAGQMPRLATTSGHAVTVPGPAVLRAAPAAPGGLPAAYADLYVSEGRGSGQIFGDTPAAAHARAMPAVQNRALAPDGTASYAPVAGSSRMYALATADGGVLALFSVVIREEDRGTRADSTLYPSPRMAVYTGGLGASWFRIDHLHLGAAYLPAQGPVQLLAMRSSIVAVQAPDPVDAGQ